MTSEEVLFGVQIGRAEVRAVAGRVTAAGVQLLGDSAWPVTGLDTVGAVLRPDAVAEAVRTAVQDAAEEAGMPVLRVELAFPGGLTEAREITTSIEVPDQVLSPLDLARARRSALARADEQVKLLHARLKRVAVDRDPVVPERYLLTATFLFLTVDPGALSRHEHAAALAGLEVTGSTPAPLAAAEATLTLRERERGIGVAHLEGEWADLALYRSGSLQYASSVPIEALAFEFAGQGGSDFFPAGLVLTGTGALDPALADLQGLSSIPHRWGGPGGTVRADRAVETGLILRGLDALHRADAGLTLGEVG